MYKKIVALTLLVASSMAFADKVPFKAEAKRVKQENIQIDKKYDDMICPEDDNPIQDVLEDIHFESDYDKSSYFSHLKSYSARNNLGSCGFVSLIQALSYYDTFYNDNIIPEQYDRNPGNYNSFEDAKLVSPGVLRNYYYGSTRAGYYTYCHSNMDEDLESKLTVIHNQNYNTDFENEDFLYSIGGWDYQELLDNFYQEFNSNITVNVVSNLSGTNEFFEQRIKTIIDSGHPAVVHIKKMEGGTQHAYHSVVAYEYDEDGIWANFGWESDSDNHQLLLGGTNGYNTISQVFYLDFTSNPEVHSNNYIVRNVGWCGCNISNDIVIERGTHSAEMGPILYWRKDATDANQWFRLDVFAGDSPYPILYWQTESNKLTIGTYNWDWILSQSANTPRYLRFELQSFMEYSLEVVCVKYLLKPNAIELTEVSMTPRDFGFEQAYYSNVRMKSHSVNGVNFTTERKRCGFIQGEKINLSARKKDEGSAYLEFYFENAYVEHISIDVSLWSDQEMINASNATILLQYENNYAVATTLCDLFNDVTLSTDRNNQNHLEFDLPIGVRTIGIYSTAEAVGTKNKGRVAIGDITFQTVPDTIYNY